MIMRIAYIAAGLGTVALLAFEAPRGGVLMRDPPRGQVSKAPTKSGSSGTRGSTVRGYGPAFVFLGGGYRGGK